MSLFIVCFDLKNANSTEYNIWENAFINLFTNNNKKIERTTWLLSSDDGADSIYTKILKYVKSEMVAREVQELKDLDCDLFEMINDYQNFNLIALEERWDVERYELKNIEREVRKYLKDVKIFIGKISNSEDNLAGCLSRNDWDSQSTSYRFNKYFINRNDEYKIKLI